MDFSEKTPFSKDPFFRTREGSAIPRQTNVKRMDANRAIRFAAQRTQGL